jgi:hypothetical protein
MSVFQLVRDVFEHQVVAAGATRLLNLFAIADQNFEVCDEWTLGFGNAVLFVRRGLRSSVCVVATAIPQPGMLRMAVNAALRELEAQCAPPEMTPALFVPMTPATPVRGSSGVYRPAASLPDLRSNPSGVRTQPGAVPSARPSAVTTPAASKPSTPGQKPKKKNPIWG